MTRAGLIHTYVGNYKPLLMAYSFICIPHASIIQIYTLCMVTTCQVWLGQDKHIHVHTSNSSAFINIILNMHIHPFRLISYVHPFIMCPERLDRWESSVSLGAEGRPDV